MEYISLEMVDKLSTVAVLVLVALAVITEKLVWHKRHKEVVEQRDRWQNVALEALKSGAQAGVKSAEVAAAVVAAMPDPARVAEEE